MKQTSIRIAQRFCGPPDSGNGGYVCGILDEQTPYVSEVTLRKPPPLEKDLQLVWKENELYLMDGEALVASVRPGSLDQQAPPTPGFAQAQAAASRHIGHQTPTAFPTCFVCGLERAAKDGLAIYAGPVEGQDIYAAPWVPDASLSDDGTSVRPEFIWAALDCPGAYAAMGQETMTIVLGRFTVELMGGVVVGEKCTVVAWTKGVERKKHFCGTALYGETGKLVAVGHATWIALSNN
ncbi:MAG: hotdog fold domain-containing protein [Bacteroidota bacterium]